MSIAPQPVYHVRPDKPATADNDYFHVTLLASVAITFIAVTDGRSMLTGAAQYLADSLDFP
jgi:hypothetical protein